MSDDRLNDKDGEQLPGQSQEGLAPPEGGTEGAATETDESDEVPEKRDIGSTVKTVIIVCVFLLVFFIGLVIMFYPSISNYVNRKNQSRAVSSYAEAIGQIDQMDYESYLEAARAYNTTLSGAGADIGKALALAGFDGDRTSDYWDLLSVDGSSVIGYVVIELLDVEVPLYHGTSEAVLSSGAGHIQGTSLPVGGESTHTVVSAHTGLPSAKFFDGVDTLRVGDTFALHVMNEVLTYEVDQVLVVLPEEVEALSIEAGQDYATLVTCTPYGINSHRLLIRGTRVETPPDQLSKSDNNADDAENQPDRQTWMQKAEGFIVEGLSAVVELIAGGIVNVAQWVMDKFDIAY